MKKLIWKRKRNTIEKVGTMTYDSISLAKKESRKLQLGSDGGLGRGSLQVINIPKNKCHIDMFDIELCQKTINICSLK